MSQFYQVRRDIRSIAKAPVNASNTPGGQHLNRPRELSVRAGGDGRGDRGSCVCSGGHDVGEIEDKAVDHRADVIDRLARIETMLTERE